MKDRICPAYIFGIASIFTSITSVSREHFWPARIKAITCCGMSQHSVSTVRDWSLITGRGGLQNWWGGGGHVKFYPDKKGGGEVLAMLKGGHKMFWGSFYAVAWSFSHIVGGA